MVFHHSRGRYRFLYLNLDLAAILEGHGHVDLLRQVKAKRMYFAYDTADDYEPLLAAGKLLQAGGITRQSHRARCYVLIGYQGDGFEAAEKRLLDTWAAGFAPYAMLYKNEDGQTDPEWRQFQRMWVRPQIMFSRLKELG